MKNIFVGNLSFGTTEQDIRSLFEAHGSVDRVNIVTDRDTGQPRGFAFVEMTNDGEGDRAIEAECQRDGHRSHCGKLSGCERATSG